MKAEIIAIGNEIILGDLINTNTAYISKKLSETGVEVTQHTAIPDDGGQIRKVIKTALNRSNIVITVGGLGPTADDITVKNIAEALERRLVFDKNVEKRIERHFKKRNLRCPSINFKQAYRPKGAISLINKIGTAPGLIIEKNGVYLIALPGPPTELMPIFEESVIPFLKNKKKVKKVIISRTIKTVGCQESQVAAKIHKLLSLKGEVTLGSYPYPHQVELKITARASSKKQAGKKIDKIHNIIKKRLGNLIFGINKDTIESVVGKLLVSKKKNLAIAESCTGGLISSRITDIPGSSRYFLVGIVAYSNAEKTRLLEIKKAALKKYGAVSAETAKYMAKNLQQLSKADYALSTTGIAGPGGGTAKKPVGLVYIGLASKKGCRVKKFLFLGSRDTIKLQASEAALNMLRKELL